MASHSILAAGMGIAGHGMTKLMGNDMNVRFLMAAGAALLMPLGALAAIDAVEAPAGTAPQQAPAESPYAGFNKQVQEKLQQLGFYSGPLNGDFGPNTQAALAQFQLSVPLPASGSLDEQTVAALGIGRDDPAASAGQSAEPTDAMPQQPAAEAAPNPS
ncbi:MAG: peptidoglycan-binding domain-containing protein [Burkholderiales bacterium]